MGWANRPHALPGGPGRVGALPGDSCGRFAARGAQKEAGDGVRRRLCGMGRGIWVGVGGRHRRPGRLHDGGSAGQPAGGRGLGGCGKVI